MTIIRHSGVVFEGEQGKKYASAIARIVHSVQTGLDDVSSSHNDGVSEHAALSVPYYRALTLVMPVCVCFHRTSCAS